MTQSDFPKSHRLPIFLTQPRSKTDLYLPKQRLGEKGFQKAITYRLFSLLFKYSAKRRTPFKAGGAVAEISSNGTPNFF